MSVNTEILADSPDVLWDLGETLGTNANDATANNRDGTYAGSYTLNQTSLYATDADPAVKINSTADSVRSASYIFNAGDATLRGRFKIVTLPASGQTLLMSCAPASGGFDKTISVRSDGKVEWMLYCAGVTVIAVSATALVAGNTYDIAATVDATDARIYINGVLDGTPASTTVSTFAGYVAPNCLVGGSAGSYNSNGVFVADKCAWFPSKLSAVRIAAHYSADLVASSYTMTGPSIAYVGYASTNFTVTPNGSFTGTITPASDGSGTFSPASLTWAGTAEAKTFAYTPSSASGSPHTISATDSGSLTDPASIDVTISTATVTPTTPRCFKVAGYGSAVTWASSGLTGNVDVKLSIDNGSSYPYTLASGIPAVNGIATFWIESARVASQCKIKITDGTTEGITSAFAIVAASVSVLKPILSPGAGSSAVSDPGGSGPIVKARWDIVPGEEFTGTAIFGANTLCSHTTVTGVDKIQAGNGIECVAFRVDGGAWAYVPHVSLNTDRAARQSEWQSVVDGLPSLNKPTFNGVTVPIVRATQEHCFRLDAANHSQGPLTLQGIAYAFDGTHTILPDIVIYCDKGTLEHQAYYVATSTASIHSPGSDSNDGLTTSTPFLTVNKAAQKLVDVAKTNGGTIHLEGRGRMDGPTTAVSNDRHIWIKPWPGQARNTAVLEGATNGAYWQVARTRLSVLIDGRVDVAAAGTLWAIAVTNLGGSLWFDNFEYQGAGASIIFDIDAFNGFYMYWTDGYFHDVGVARGGNQMQVIGEIVRNVYDRDHMGDVPHQAHLISNFSIRRQLQASEMAELPTFTANAGADTIALTPLTASTGNYRVFLTNSGGALPGGLTGGGTEYWINYAESPNFKLYTSSASATAQTGAVDITTAGTGTHTLHYYADVHADLFQNLGADPADSIVVNMLVDSHYVIFNYSYSGSAGWINCGFYNSVGGAGGIAGDFEDALILYNDWDQSNAWGPGDLDGTGSVSNSVFHGNSWYAWTVSSGDPDEDADWTYNNFVTGPVQGSNSTTGALVDGNGGLAVYPYDVLNNRRGVLSENHVTNQGPYAAADEYTDVVVPPVNYSLFASGALR